MSDDVIEGEEGDSPVIGERVQVLAQGIYDELQGMMDLCGQESISNLMPLVVNILENLDSALSDNQVGGAFTFNPFDLGQCCLNHLTPFTHSSLLPFSTCTTYTL
jgi:hypothetical protein